MFSSLYFVEQMEDKSKPIVLLPLAASQLDETLENYFADPGRADETVLVYLYANLQQNGQSVCASFSACHHTLNHADHLV